MPRKVLDTPKRSEATTTRVLGFLRRNVFAFIAFGLGAVAIALFFGYTPSVGREAILAGLCLAWGVIAGFPTSGFVIDKLGDEPGVFLVDVDVADPDHDGGIYWSPYSDFQEFDIVDGELDQWAPFLYCGKHVDLEAKTVEGVWIGTMTDRELLTALSAVKECRGMLEEDARRAFALETNIWSIVYRAAKDATKAVVNTFESGTLPDEGEGVDRAVNDALEEFDLDRMADRIDDDENADLDDLLDAADDDLEADDDLGSGAEPADQQPDQPTPADD